MADAMDDNGINYEDTEKEYWSFFKSIIPVSYRLTRRYGSMATEMEHFNITTIQQGGYWADYYDDLESGWINKYLIDEIRIFEKHISYQAIKEAENNFFKKAAKEF